MLEDIFKKCKELLEKEKKESFENTQNDIIASLFSDRKKAIENYKGNEIISTDLQIYAILERLPYRIEDKWYGNEEISNYLLDRSDEFGLESYYSELGKEIRGMTLFDEMLDSYTNSAYHFIFEKLKKKLIEITNTLEDNNTKEIKTKDFIEFLDKFIKLETGLFKEQKELIKETYYFFRNDVENDKDRLWRNADYYTKHMNSYYKTKNFLERNYKPITKYLIELAKNEYDIEKNIKNDNLNSVKRIEIK